MKIIFFMAATIFSFAQFSLATPAPVPDAAVERATLVDFFTGHDLLGEIQTGSVTVSHIDKTVTLNLQPAWSCPPGLFCPAAVTAVMPETEVIELPLVESYQNECGAVIHRGLRNNTAADGLREVIRVVDNRENTCESVVPYMTAVDYITVAPKTSKVQVSYFGGEELVSVLAQ